MGTGFPETRETRQREACVVGFCHFLAVSPKVLVFPSFMVLNFVTILFHYIFVSENVIISNIDCMVCLALKKKGNMGQGHVKRIGEEGLVS